MSIVSLQFPQPVFKCLAYPTRDEYSTVHYCFQHMVHYGTRIDIVIVYKDRCYTSVQLTYSTVQYSTVQYSTYPYIPVHTNSRYSEVQQPTGHD